MIFIFPQQSIKRNPEILPAQRHGHPVMRPLPQYQRVPGHTGRSFTHAIHRRYAPDEIRGGELAFQ